MVQLLIHGIEGTMHPSLDSGIKKKGLDASGSGGEKQGKDSIVDVSASRLRYSVVFLLFSVFLLNLVACIQLGYFVYLETDEINGE